MTKLLIIVSIILVIGLIIIIGSVIGFIPWHQDTPAETVVSSTPEPRPTPSIESTPTQTVEPAPALQPTSSAIPEPVTTSEPTTASNPPPDQNEYVKFNFAVTDISGSGLSRTIVAEITNTGTMDAHNVWYKVEITSADSKIKLNGEEYLRVDIGTLKNGDTVKSELTISVSITDGLKIASNGFRLILTMNSDEHSETLYYDYGS